MHDLTFPLRWRVALVAPALAVFLAFWLLPMAALVQLSADGHFIATYQALLTNGRYMTSLLQTVLTRLTIGGAAPDALIALA